MRGVVLITCSVMFGGAAFSASPVATVSSSGVFELHGAKVNVNGVPSWPVMAGDDIRTTSAPALIQFRDGTRATLAEKSQAIVEKSEGGLLLRLRTGTMEFKIASGSPLKVFNGDKPVAAVAGITTSATVGARVVAAPATTRARRPPPPPVSP